MARSVEGQWQGQLKIRSGKGLWQGQEKVGGKVSG